MRKCQTVKRNLAARNEATRPKKSENEMVLRRFSEGARGCQIAKVCQLPVVPEGARWSYDREGRATPDRDVSWLSVLDCPSFPVVVAKVSIAGVEVAALLDTGATTSCCRWGRYKKTGSPTWDP